MMRMCRYQYNSYVCACMHEWMCIICFNCGIIYRLNASDLPIIYVVIIMFCTFPKKYPIALADYNFINTDLHIAGLVSSECVI